MEKKRGGKREGAGRPSIGRYKTPLNLLISSETKDLLNTFSECLGISKSDLVDRFMLGELPKSKKIVWCPHCNSPLAWLSHLPESDTIRCNRCNSEFDKNTLISRKKKK